MSDGMKVNERGYIFCTGPGGIWVFDPGGRHLGTILIPELPANCAWGDNDFRSLYVTARTSLYKVRVNIPGVKNL
jgi:gluconolactonase